MKVSELKKGFYQFGNKGNVWSDNTHIASAIDHTFGTLCGIPMLSSNWAQIEEHPEVKCPKCLAVYEYLQKLEWNRAELNKGEFI